VGEFPVILNSSLIIQEVSPVSPPTILNSSAGSETALPFASSTPGRRNLCPFDSNYEEEF